ncbi:MAG: DUF5312 family protein [Treponema sp.]|nr:DUF5312 family protein [Treponema sp.]
MSSTNKAPKNKSSSNAKEGFFQTLINNLFNSNSPEAELKRKMKSIAKALSKTKYHVFYKPATFEVLPPFAKLFYDIYKIVASAQIIFRGNQNPNFFKHQIVNFSLSEHQVELLEHFDEHKIIEMSKKLPAEKLKEQVEADLVQFSTEFTTERINKIENIYTAFSLFNDFCSFDYYALLKKFASSLQENNFTDVPNFDKLNAEYIVDDLKDFCLIAYPITNETIIWNDLFEFLKASYSADLVTLGTWKKVVAKIRAIQSSSAFEMMIRHISRNPKYITDVRTNIPTIVDSYTEKIQSDTHAILSRLVNQEKESKAANLCSQIFGETELKGLKNYVPSVNSNLERKNLETFCFCEPLNYLKVFLVEFVKKDIREFFDVVVIRGQWDSQLSAPMSNAYQELLKISDEITKFDNAVAENGSIGTKIKTTLPKVGHDSNAESIMNRIVIDTNEMAKHYILTSTQDCITIGRTVKQLIEDYSKQKPELISNWRELERFLDHPMKDFSVNIYKKLYLFVQLMQQYLGK